MVTKTVEIDMKYETTLLYASQKLYFFFFFVKSKTQMTEITLSSWYFSYIEEMQKP